MGYFTFYLTFQIYTVDLSKTNSKEFETILTSSAYGKQYELHFLVHNAGTTLNDVRAAEADNIEQFNEYKI